MSTHLRLSRAVVIGAALATLVGCVDERDGRPTPADSGDSSSQASTTARPSTTSASSDGLAALDPCELLTAAELAQLRLPTGQHDSVAGNPKCNWNPSGEGLVAATIRADGGIDDLSPSNATKIEEVTIGAHRGRRLEFPEGDCSVDIAVTEKSSVTVTALAGDLAQACALAVQAATLIEPKLPRG